MTYGPNTEAVQAIIDRRDIDDVDEYLFIAGYARPTPTPVEGEGASRERRTVPSQDAPHSPIRVVLAAAGGRGGRPGVVPLVRDAWLQDHRRRSPGR